MEDGGSKFGTATDPDYRSSILDSPSSTFFLTRYEVLNGQLNTLGN
jgi:hypothetical protein